MDSRVHARYLDVRLFMEGIEVDVTSVKTTCGVGTSGTATITIPAVDAAHKFLPRTLVHLFYFDSRYELGTAHRMVSTGGFEDGVSPFPEVAYTRHAEKHGVTKQREYGRQDHTSDADKDRAKAGVATLLTDKDDWRNWKLLFVGEVMGYSFKKVGGRREIVLACQDHSSYWDNCRLYWGQKRKGVFNAYKTSTFSGATQLYRGKSKVDSSGDLLRLLNKKPSSMPSVPGLMGGIFSVMESATGVFMPGKSRFRGANDFISQAEIRLKLTRQVGASVKDTTSATFTKSRSFRRYILKVSKAVSYTATFRQFTDMLCGKIYHTWHSQLAPPYFSEEETVEGEYVISGENTLKHNTDLSNFHKAVKATYHLANKQMANAARDKLSKVASREASIAFAKDRILWKNQKEIDVEAHKKFDELNTKSGILSNKTGAKQPKLLLAPSEIDKDPIRIKGNKIREKIKEGAKKKGAKERKALERQAHHIFLAYQSAGRARMKAAELLDTQVKGPGYDETKSLEKAAELKHTVDSYRYIRGHLEEALKSLAKATGRIVRTVKRPVELNERLYTSYFHPDLYMCPPPKCNVLFPDAVQSITFSRNWMSEVSRLWLHGKTESGRDKKNCYFSPNGLMLAGPTHKDCDQAVRNGAGFVMAHEKYTGIVPSFMGLGDNDIFKKLHNKELRKAKKEFLDEPSNRGKTFDATSVSGEAKFSPQPHLQRAANYMFFAQRYGARKMRVVCKFSPQLIAGMPALVLDPVRQKGSEAVKRGTEALELSDKKPVGTHYVGTIADITHVIDVDGGAQTVVILEKCREHTEGAALFGKTGEQGIVAAVRGETKTGKTLVKPKKGETHKAGISSQKGVDKGLAVDRDARSIIGKQFKRGVRYSVEPILGKDNEFKRVSMPALFGTFASQDDGKYVDSSGKVLGSVDGVEVNVYRYYSHKETQTTKFTWEASVMPPWFSSIYFPSKIGSEYYTPMYGCVSVLDDPPITFKEGDAGAHGTSDGGDSTTLLVPFAIPGPGGKSGTGYKKIRIPKEFTEGASTTQEAADNLAWVWLGLKEIGAQTDLFIDGYVNRRYATMLDVMGNQNTGLILKTYEYRDVNEGISIRGFHGDAYGLLEGLKDWDGEDIQPLTLPKITGAPQLKPRPVDASIDPRKERYRRVQKYIGELRNNGFRNVADYDEPPTNGQE